MATNFNDDTVPFGDDFMQTTKLPHPYVTFFHLFFRGAALATYIFCGWFSDSFITSFVFVILFLSADFWTVKNITGRLMVGLRWWNHVDDDGVSHWIYETKEGRVNPHEQRIFWMGLTLFPMMWGLLFMIALFGFKFKWLMLVLIAMTLNGANLYGYIKCRYGTNTNLNSAASDFVRNQLIQNAVGIISRPAQPTATRPTGVV